MARKQVLVQLDDELLARLDEAAAREHRSRSELIRRAISLLLDLANERAIDRSYARAYADGSSQEPSLDDWSIRNAAEGAPPYEA